MLRTTTTLPFILERFHCVCVWLKSFQHFFYNLQLSHSLQWALLVHCKMHFNPLKALCWCLPWRSLFSRNWRMTDVCKIAFFPFYSLPLLASPFEPWEFKHFCSLKMFFLDPINHQDWNEFNCVAEYRIV